MSAAVATAASLGLVAPRRAGVRRIKRVLSEEVIDCAVVMGLKRGLIPVPPHLSAKLAEFNHRRKSP